MLTNILEIVICHLFFKIFNAIKVSGHRSNIQNILGQFFIKEKNAEVIPTVTGDS